MTIDPGVFIICTISFLFLLGVTCIVVSMISESDYITKESLVNTIHEPPENIYTVELYEEDEGRLS